MFTFTKKILQNFLSSNEQKVRSKEQKVSPHKKCAAEPYSVSVNVTTFPSGNLLSFRKNLLERLNNNYSNR